MEKSYSIFNVCSFVRLFFCCLELFRHSLICLRIHVFFFLNSFEFFNTYASESSILETSSTLLMVFKSCVFVCLFVLLAGLFESSVVATFRTAVRVFNE